MERLGKVKLELNGPRNLPTISEFYGIAIRMYWNDHPPPHFHAVYADYEAKIDIRTLEVIEGQLPGRALALVSEWAQTHRIELAQDWELCSTNQPINKIAPLP